MFIATYLADTARQITSRYNSNRNPYGIWTNKGQSISSIKIANDDGEVNEYWLPTAFVTNLKRRFLGFSATEKQDLTIDNMGFVEARMVPFTKMPAITKKTVAYKHGRHMAAWFTITPEGEKYRVERFNVDPNSSGNATSHKVTSLTRKQLERMRPTLIQVSKSPRTELQQSLINIFGTIEAGMTRSEVIEFCKNSDEFRSTMMDSYSVNEIIEAIQTM
jgi:hypothetical protein